jgi:hypothetical protein
MVGLSIGSTDLRISVPARISSVVVVGLDLLHELSNSAVPRSDDKEFLLVKTNLPGHYLRGRLLSSRPPEGSRLLE